MHEHNFHKSNGEEHASKVNQIREIEEKGVVEEISEIKVEKKDIKLSPKPLCNVIDVISLDNFNMNVLHEKVRPIISTKRSMHTCCQ